jgi:protocatechuate 3,4-dioxygenase beta subunit
VEVLLAREDAPPRPIADVGGTLVDDEGRPLADVEVAAGSVDPVRTDDAGRFVLHGVHPGLVRVRVEGPPGDSERLERTVWAPVEDVRLVVPRPATLVVRVRAEEGRVPGGWLELQGPGVISGRWRATVRTTFRTVGTGLCEMTVDVEPTVATVRLEADGFLPLAWPVTAAPGERIELPVRVLRRSLALEGRVLDPWGRPQNEALVEVRERDERAAQGLRPYRPVAETDEAGRFRIEGLAPGEIVLRAEALDLVSPDRTVTVSDAHQPVDLRLPPVARVRGRVLDRRGDPVGGAVVRLAAPDDERAATPPTRTTSDVAGRFVVLVPAGRYRLWSGDDPMPKASPDAHVVTLAERDDVEVRLVANP